MAIVSFWSSRKRETNQSISAIASALQMGIDRNLKILLIDTNFSDSTYNKCFNIESEDKFVKTLNRGKIDISSGVEGLILAVNSNKTSPEIIQNYTQPILKGRLDLLNGMSTKNKDQYNLGYVNYPDIIEIANQFYDVVIVDLPKGFGDKVTTKILAMSNIIVVTFDQDRELIEDFERIWGNDPLFSPKQKVIPLLTKEDRFSIYNNNNVARMIKMSPGMPSIIYNTQFMEAVQRGEGSRFFIDLNMSSATSRNKLFLDVVVDLNTLLIDRIQQQKYNGSFNKNSVDNIIREHVLYMSKAEGNKKRLNNENQDQKQEKIEEHEKNQNIKEQVEQYTEEKNINVNEIQNINLKNEQENTFKNQGETIDQNMVKNTNTIESQNAEHKTEKKEGIFGFFKSVFKKQEERNEVNTPKEIIKTNDNGNLNKNEEKEINEEFKQQTQNSEENLIDNIDKMSIEAAKNITSSLNDDVLNKNEVEDALTEAQKIMLENKMLLKQLEESNKEKEKQKSTLNFSGIKPLNEEEINKTDLYKADEDGKLDEESTLLDQNLNEIDIKLDQQKQSNKIDFSNIKPLSEEKDEIALKQNEKIQEELKNKLLNKTTGINEKVEIKEEVEENSKNEFSDDFNKNINMNTNTKADNEKITTFNPILGIIEETEKEDKEEKDNKIKEKKLENVNTNNEESIDDLI